MPATAVEVDPEDYEDVRLGVVLNGGVSLAVWMAGVTNEINRLVLSSSPGSNGGGTYGGLLELLKSTARVDVISGTSAGGINGAFLALASVYGSDLSMLGRLWTRDGTFQELLRSPLEKDPKSILRGDYFQERLRVAFEEVFPRDYQSVYRPPRDAPIDLTITATLLSGTPVHFVDDFGTPITEVNHRGRFHLERREGTPPQEDPFYSPSIVDKLAVAARATASFPAAFEPTYVRVGTDAKGHVDMVGIAKFPSGHVVDGGVLLNQPIRPALEAIADLPADRQVRRILAYVNPDPRPEPNAQSPGERDAGPPALFGVLASSLIGLPSAQSVQLELEAIQEQNRNAQDRRLTRVDLAKVLGDDVVPMATRLFESYQAIRLRRTISYIADVVSKELAAARGALTSSTPGSDSEQVGPEWTREEFVAALEDPSVVPEFRYIPSELPAFSGQGLPDTRQWGVSPVERLSAVAVDVFRRALWIVPVSHARLRHDLRVARGRLHESVESIRAVRDIDERFWREEAQAKPPSDSLAPGVPRPPSDSSERPAKLQEWAKAALRRWPDPHQGTPEEMRVQGSSREELVTRLETAVLAVTRLLVSYEAKLRAAVQAGLRSGVPDLGVEAEKLKGLLNVIFGGDTKTSLPGQLFGTTPFRSSLRACLVRLMALEVCQLTLGGTGQGWRSEQEVELVQISGNTEASFGKPRRSAKEKLAGAQLGHFGAFYKESWRRSDWIWGRLDAATRLCLALLSPQRLRQLRFGTEGALDAVHKIAVLDAPEGDREELEARFPKAACANELQYLSEASWPAPPSLPHCAMALARRLHLEILRTEVPQLSTAVRQDLRQGHSAKSQGASFVTAYDQHVDARGELPARALFDLFDGANIGSERVGTEFPSDMLAATAARTAAVTVNTAQSAAVNLKPARPVRPLLRALRGFTLTLYALVSGATSGSTVGRAVVQFLLVFGGAGLALALLVDDTPPLIEALGVAIVLSGFGAAALRKKMRPYAVVLLATGMLVLIGGVFLTRNWDAVLKRFIPIVIVAAVVLLFMLLGYISTAPSQATPAKERLGFQIFRDAAGEYRWRLVKANGKILAESAEGYRTKQGARHAARRMIEITQDAAPHFHE